MAVVQPIHQTMCIRSESRHMWRVRCPNAILSILLYLRLLLFIYLFLCSDIKILGESTKIVSLFNIYTYVDNHFIDQKTTTFLSTSNIKVYVTDPRKEHKTLILES